MLKDCPFVVGQWIYKRSGSLIPHQVVSIDAFDRKIWVKRHGHSKYADVWEQWFSFETRQRELVEQLLAFQKGHPG